MICVWFKSSGIRHATPVRADPHPSHTSAALPDISAVFPAGGTESSSAWVIAIAATAEPLSRDRHTQELTGSERYQYPSSHCRAAPQHQVRCHPAQKGGCHDRAAQSIHISINPKPKPCVEAQHWGVQNSLSLFYRQRAEAPNLGCKIPATYPTVSKHTSPSARNSQILTTSLFSDGNTLKIYFY